MKILSFACSSIIRTVFASADLSSGSDDELTGIFSPAMSDEIPAVVPTNAPVKFPVEISPGMFITEITDRDRAVEWYNLTLITEKINADVAAKIERQIKADKQYDLFTPDTGLPDANGPPVWTEYTPLGEISLGRRLYRGTESVIYEIQDQEEYLMKYQANCDEIQDAVALNEPIMHPLLTDYWYSREAQSISSKVIFISPPGFLCKGRFGKCDFSLSDEEFAQCYENWGTVRFMIMRKESGIDLQSMRSKYPDGVVPFGYVMSLGSHLMGMLELLHTKARIVHGDLHAANIMLVTDKPGSKTLKLIDFGRAFRLTPKSNQPRYPINRFRHFLFSHWQAVGLEWGARDDLIKVLQVMAQLMNPWSYMDYENALEKKGQATLQMFKRSSFIFVQPEFPKYQRPFDPIDRLPIANDAKVYIRNQLGQILDHIRGLSDINAVPHYKGIIARLDMCKKLADKEVVLATVNPMSSDPEPMMGITNTTTTSTSSTVTTEV